jgi:uncharacterized protein YjlB
MRGPDATDRAGVALQIAGVPLPAGDPVFGSAGLLRERWRAAERD